MYVPVRHDLRPFDLAGKGDRRKGVYVDVKRGGGRKRTVEEQLLHIFRRSVADFHVRRNNIVEKVKEELWDDEIIFLRLVFR